jgi:hypothetical protein
MTRESEYTANKQLAQSVEPHKPFPVRASSALGWLLGDIADRMAPLLALCGLMFSIGLLGSADDLQHRIWALMALVFSCVAMWAFWGDRK